MPDSEASKNQVNSITLVQITFFKEFVVPAGAEINSKSEIVTPDNTYTDYAKGIKYTQLGYSCSGKNSHSRLRQEKIMKHYLQHQQLNVI